MASATEYRELARQQQIAANEATLPLVRQRHISAAERWQTLADEAETIAAYSQRNHRQQIFA